MRQFKILFIDLGLIALATLGAAALRDNLVLPIERQEALLPYLVMTVAIGALVLTLSGVSRMIWRFSGFDDYRRLVAACVVIVLLAVAAGFALDRLEHVPRSLPILQAMLMVGLMIGVRAGMRVRLTRRGFGTTGSAGGTSAETVLVVGLNRVAELFIEAVAEAHRPGIAIAGVIGRTDRHRGQLFRGLKVLGTPEEIGQIVRDLDVHGVTVNRIVVAVPNDRLSQTAHAELAAIAGAGSITVDHFVGRLGLAPSSLTAAESAQAIDALAAAPTGIYWRLKRFIDIALAGALLLALLPIIVAFAILTAIVHGLPIIFWQQRPGLNGQPINVYKFRSLLAAHDKLGQRLPDDLRITWLGRFMRATRVDELPQLVSILRGDMSFIGPRPLLPIDQLDEYKARLSVRPGLTGWAQVNGGKQIGANDKMALDLWYIRNASLALDIRIMALTLKTVFAGEQTNDTAIEQAWLEIERAKA